MYRALILDMDGTVIDSKEIVLESIGMLAAENGLTLTDEQRKRSLGCTSDAFMAELGFGDRVPEASERWRAILKDMLDRAPLYGGMDHVLEAPVRRGVVTSQIRVELAANLARLGIGHRFEYTVCADDLPHQKPHPMPLLHCVAGLGLCPGDALFVGDTRFDLECALAAGVDFGLALWGAGSADGFEAADYVFRRPAEILRLGFAPADP